MWRINNRLQKSSENFDDELFEQGSAGRRQDDTVYVMTSFILADLNDVDAVQQRLVTTAYLRIIWIDEFLQWDKYTTGVERLYFKQVICCSYLSVKKNQNKI